jgi:hypothetical protein
VWWRGVEEEEEAEDVGVHGGSGFSSQAAPASRVRLRGGGAAPSFFSSPSPFSPPAAGRWVGGSIPSGG